jgi:hypothetical protein
MYCSRISSDTPNLVGMIPGTYYTGEVCKYLVGKAIRTLDPPRPRPGFFTPGNKRKPQGEVGQIPKKTLI